MNVTEKEGPVMTSHPVRSVVPVSLVACLLLSSCAIFTPATRLGVVDVKTETLKNGHLIQLRVDRPVGPVSAVVTQGNWLLVTFVDSLLDANALESFRSEFIDSVEITHFPSALQLSFHLTVAVDAVEVVHVEPSRDVLISLFTPGPKHSERRRYHRRDGAMPPHLPVVQEARVEHQLLSVWVGQILDEGTEPQHHLPRLAGRFGTD